MHHLINMAKFGCPWHNRSAGTIYCPWHNRKAQQNSVATPWWYHRKPLMSPCSRHQWRFNKDRAELKSLKMENVICHVRFKGLIAKWEHGAWLTEQWYDILGGHQRIFTDTAFPACCCLTPLGPGACAEPTMLSPGTKMSMCIWPRISSLVLKEKKNHPQLITCMAHTKSTSTLPL